MPYRLAMLLLIAVGCCPVLAQDSGDYYASGSKPASWAVSTNKTWMKQLDSRQSLATISMPGTHDSCALHSGPNLGFAKPWVVTQKWSITDQLQAGIRFLDIRCRMINNGFAIHHGEVYQKISFNNVQKQCINFLKANPSECIVMRVKKEHTTENCTKTFAQIFADSTRNHGRYWYRENAIPKLSEVRGKIVLLYSESGIGGINFGDSSKINKQDYWSVKDLRTKWNKVYAQINNANRGDRNKIYVNFLSGNINIDTSNAKSFLNSKVLSIPQIASAMNKNVYNTLRGKLRIGILPMDMPGERLIRKVIDMNFGTRDYRVSIQTGTSNGAGTDANIYLSIVGSQGTIHRVRLNGMISGNAFENSKTDQVTLKGMTDVGKMTSIYVRSDNRYPGSDWQLGSVTINDGRETAAFSCNAWFTSKTASRSIKRSPAMKTYSIVVKTGTKSGAGTDSNIYLTIYGSKGTTKEVRLNGYISGNAFENGDRDVARVKLRDVGTVQKIRVRSDGKWAGAGWYLDYIAIDKKPFRCYGWIESGKLTRILK